MKNKRILVQLVTFLCNFIIYALFCLWSEKYMICEYFYIAGTVIFSLLYFLNRKKTYLKEISFSFTLCAILGLVYLSSIQMQGILFAALIICCACLQYYDQSR